MNVELFFLLGIYTIYVLYTLMIDKPLGMIREYTSNKKKYLAHVSCISHNIIILVQKNNSIYV